MESSRGCALPHFLGILPVCLMCHFLSETCLAVVRGTSAASVSNLLGPKSAILQNRKTESILSSHLLLKADKNGFDVRFCSANFHKELRTKANSTLESPSWFKREGTADLPIFRLS